MCLTFLQRVALFASTNLDSIFNITRFQVFSNFHIISMLIHKLLNSTILKFLIYGGGLYLLFILIFNMDALLSEKVIFVLLILALC